ncbi:sigma factor-like helix-turn-helix DNA-binding protein [Sphingomonas flavalba]|uniref:sigma factor-like helix-turn-helix DNA-binding protein n=1 Tax=Sphingomonas flavalba TaxID=2559804 RepID=UPI0039E03857
MITSLRAFLLTRTADGEWHNEVFHALEPVLRAWEASSGAEKCAVLHVGFERRTARTFEALATQFPGKVLLTPGARGALPLTFSSSREPIGIVGSEPIYLALEGWGYSALEPETTQPARAGFGLQGWVNDFAFAHPELRDRLIDAGILCDETYVRHEEVLDADLRIRLGKFRSAALVGTASDDPTALARAAPPWLASRPIADLDLTVRIGNVFRNLDATSVADIGKMSIPELLTLQNFGRTSIRHLVSILERELAAGPRSLDVLASQKVDDTLIEAVQRSLCTLADRERDILNRRMGFNCEPETLAEIGDSYGITRERIRQIEAKVVDRLIRMEIWDDILAAKLSAMLAEREFPLPLIGAEALDPWFQGVAKHRRAVRYLIDNMCDAKVSLVDIDGIEYLGFLSQDQWNEIVGTARRLLASGVDRNWTEDDCRNHVLLLVPTEAREFGALLWDIASKWCHFADDGGARILISYGRGVDQIVEAVLLESDMPLHYSEIASQASVRAGRDLDERRVHNAAAEVGYLFGPGTYGVVKHLSVPRSEWEAFAEEAAEIVAEAGQDRQWHASEVVDLLRQRDVRIPESFDKYQMDIALKEAATLQTLGRMVWVRDDCTNDNARVDIRQAVIAILQSAGGPLTSADLRQRVVAVRGINLGMQFQVSDPLIKLDSQVWALNDRDIGLKRPDQQQFLDEVVASLRTRAKPIHISECPAVIGDQLPARAIFCLASLDPRLRTTTDRCLSLSEWA